MGRDSRESVLKTLQVKYQTKGSTSKKQAFVNGKEVFGPEAEKVFHAMEPETQPKDTKSIEWLNDRARHLKDFLDKNADELKKTADVERAEQILEQCFRRIEFCRWGIEGNNANEAVFSALLAYEHYRDAHFLVHHDDRLGAGIAQAGHQRSGGLARARHTHERKLAEYHRALQETNGHKEAAYSLASERLGYASDYSVRKAVKEST